MRSLRGAAGRRYPAAALVALALGALLWRARPDRPVGLSLEVARRFWAADAKTRLYNSALFAVNRALGRALIEADEALPLTEDVRVCLPDPSEDERRKAAFVLAPRHVVVVPGCAGVTVSPLR